MSVAIEPMQLKHVDRVAAIEEEVYPSPWSKSSFITEILDNSFASYYVATENGAVVGYAGIWTILDEAHITTLAVSGEKQGEKIGCALLERIMAAAAQKGAIRMTLEVRVSNTKAQALYKKYGFVIRGIRPRYYNNEDAFIMWLDNLAAPRPANAAAEHA